MVLWTEKYRPKSLEGFDGPAYIKQFLEHAIANGHPHLLLYGPPGAGKTTIAMMLSPTLVLNASDERGIDTIREKIKKTASTVARQVILLDECENLTKDAQTCLRRILEDYTNTRFIFCTNYRSRIIAPLQSRLLRIKISLKETSILPKIGNAEGFSFSENFYTRLFAESRNDLRKAVTVLQGLKPQLESCSDETENAAEEISREFIGKVPRRVLEEFMSLSLSNFREFVSDFIFEGRSVLHLIEQLSECLGGTDAQKSEYSLILARAEGRALGGASDEMLLMDLVLKKIDIYGSRGELSSA